MLRKIGTIVSGLVAFAIVGGLLILLLRVTWPAYEAAHPTKAFTLAMLLARLTIGASACLAAGAVIMRIAGTTGKAILLCGLVLLLISLTIHLREPVWSQYPGWYHFVYLGYIMPLVLFGGRLMANRGR
jgi:hypothetical protein